MVFCGEKRGELMVFCGDLGGRFSASKKMSPFENISVDFLVTLWWGESRRTMGEQKVG
jgi:hypothetical protein